MSNVKLYTLHVKLKSYMYLGYRYTNIGGVLSNGIPNPTSVDMPSVIENYEPGCDGEAAVNDYFTWEEAYQVKSEIEALGDECEVIEVDLPISRDDLPLFDLCPGEFDSFCGLAEIYRCNENSILRHIKCYAFIEGEERHFVADDFEIRYQTCEKEETQCFCGKSISVSDSRFRIRATHFRSYWLVCSDCAAVHAPELRAALNAFYNSASTPVRCQDLANERQQALADCSIRYRSPADQTPMPCHWCQKPVKALSPFAIAWQDGASEIQAVCKSCCQEHVPELMHILEAIYESGLDKEFVLRFQREQELLYRNIQFSQTVL